MKSELKIETFTLLGVFNPKKFDRYFFDKNDIVAKENIHESSSFTDNEVKVVTPNFRVFVNDFQFTIHKSNPIESDNALSVVLVKILKYGDLNIIGSALNFHWFITGDDLNELTKKISYNSNNPILQTYFNSDTEKNVRYGFYASKDMFGGRLKLDVKPITFIDRKNNNKKIEAIKFDYSLTKTYGSPSNFESDINSIIDNYLNIKINLKEMTLAIL